MKTFLLALFLMITTLGFAQAPTKIRSVTTLPATCHPGDGVQPTDIIAQVSGGATTIYYCASTNIWAVFGSIPLEPSIRKRVCTISIGDTSATNPLISQQIGPQARLCYIAANSMITEIDVTADAGSPTVLIGDNRAGTVSNLTTSALATGSNGAPACANQLGGLGLDGVTTCTSILLTYEANVGDYLELEDGSVADGVARHITVQVIYTVN